MLLNHVCMFSIGLLIKNVCHAQKPSLYKKTLHQNPFPFDLLLSEKHILLQAYKAVLHINRDFLGLTLEH